MARGTRSTSATRAKGCKGGFWEWGAAHHRAIPVRARWCGHASACWSAPAAVRRLPWADSEGPTENYAIGESMAVLSPIVRSARHRRHCRTRLRTAGHGAEPARSCSAQRCSAPPTADPTGTMGRGAGHGGSCPAQRDQALSTADHLGTRAVSQLRELRAGAEHASSRSKLR